MGSERRKERRTPVFRALPVRVLELVQEPLTGHILELAPKGVRLLLLRPVAVKSHVHIESGALDLIGEVCYCRKGDKGYIVGVKLKHSVERLAQLRELNRVLLTEMEAGLETSLAP